MSEKTKYYKLFHDNQQIPGRFTGIKPKQAAMKAFATMVHKNKINEPTEFTIKESTRGCNHKKYSYIGEKIKLEKPITVQVGNKEIMYEYSIKITRHRHKKEHNNLIEINEHNMNNYIDTNEIIHISI